MTVIEAPKKRRARIRRPPLLGLIFTFLVGATGCDVGSLLEVDNESDILEEDLNSPQAIAPVVNGVAGDFGTFYSEHALAVAQSAGELWHTGSHGHDRETSEGFLDRPSSDGNGGYNDGSRAYWVSVQARDRIREALGSEGENSAEMAEVIVWGGYTLLMLADNWCQLTFDGGPAVPPAEAYRMAETDFTRALEVSAAAGEPQWRLRALAGRARARLMLADYGGAIADAQQIPQGFEFLYDYSTNSSREYNAFPGHTRDELRREVGVHPRFWDDPARWEDPRTPMNDWGEDAVGPDAIRRWVEQDKFPDRESDMEVSSWQEVRLIQAEAEMELGNLDRARALINEVRTYADLDPYEEPLTPANVLAELRWERSAELWLQGQALLDLRRFDDPFLQQPPGRGGGLERGKCWQIGEDEWQTNPNLAGSGGGGG